MESLPSKRTPGDAGAGRTEVVLEQLQQGGLVGDRGVGLQSGVDRVIRSRSERLPPRMLRNQSLRGQRGKCVISTDIERGQKWYTS